MLTAMNNKLATPRSILWDSWLQARHVVALTFADYSNINVVNISI